jgi:hypoxanthine phosphoribosyltransferase
LKIVDWDEYNETLEKIYDEIRFHQYDDIIAIGRGGSIIGAYLASKLGIPTFHPVFLRHVGKGSQKKIVDVSPPLYNRLHSLSGKLLVVDDYLRDGTAMKYILTLISKKASVTTLVLYNREDSEYKPDIVGNYVEETEILFPYSTLG